MKKLTCKLFWALAAFLPLVFVPSKAFPADFKKATLWNTDIRYQLVRIQNDRVSYDGLSRVLKKGKDAGQNRVVLNTAFFEKEAQALWEDLRQAPAAAEPLDRDELLAKIKMAERALQNGKPLEAVFQQETLAALESWEKELRLRAWGSACRDCRQRQGREWRAKRDFIRAFSQARVRTVEYHELSHLLDAKLLETGARGQEAAHFDRFSEVRAFLTELKYGGNPQDSLWQTVLGARLEIRRGHLIDYSLTKLIRVLEGWDLSPQTIPALATRLYFQS